MLLDTEPGECSPLSCIPSTGDHHNCASESHHAEGLALFFVSSDDAVFKSELPHWRCPGGRELRVASPVASEDLTPSVQQPTSIYHVSWRPPSTQPRAETTTLATTCIAT